MYVNDQTLATLSFEKIRQRIASYTTVDESKQMCLTMMPSSNYEEVVLKLNKTEEALSFLYKKGQPNFYAPSDMLFYVTAATKGQKLSTTELLSISSFLGCVEDEIRYFDGSEPEYLGTYSCMFVGNEELHKKIRKIIISEDVIADDASLQLSIIRQKQKSLNSKIREILLSYTRGTKALYLQENIVTIRDGRYVIPVKAEYKNCVSGIVHDTSSSGATIFIEPASIVESNNELKILEGEEEKEIDRILYDLSSNVADFSLQLETDYHSVVKLSYYFACAAYAKDIRATKPSINQENYIDLVNARHPLIDDKVVVPISIAIGKYYTSLIITGPNTGGKTVTLKTLGLFSVMAQCGLLLPASEASSVCIFDNILVDIGDEQSIEASLSTFSAHMKNIVEILHKMTKKSLILLDELGSGTDPVEGAALAISILEKIKSVEGIVAATSHYAELKVYAINTDKVENASCEFNIETLRPTYKLIIGIPGKSNAFLISKKLGLSDDIIQLANTYISPDYQKYESLLKIVEKDRRKLERNLSEAVLLKKEAEKLKKETEEKIQKLEKESDEKIEKDKEKAKQLLDSARATSDFVLKELESLKRNAEKNDFNRQYNETKAAIRSEINQSEASYSLFSLENSVLEQEYVLPRALVVGDNVFVVSLKQVFTIIQIQEEKNQLVVQSGIMKVKVKISDVRLVDNEKVEAEKKKKTANTIQTQVKAFNITSLKPEIDVRGMYSDEAWNVVDKYLDDAIRASFTTVDIIHGKGTGVLRKYIQGLLRKDSRIKSYRDGKYGEGDFGVTVVELK